MAGSRGGPRRICKECGKPLSWCISPSEYAYRIGKKMYCSYTCLKKAKEELGSWSKEAKKDS